MNKRLKIKSSDQIILIILSFVLWSQTCFLIYQYSSRPAFESTGQSTRAILLINSLIPFRVIQLDPENNTTQHVIRKIAHFYMYSFLGISLFLLTFSLTVKNDYPVLCLIFVLLFSLLDEFHQCFVSGRTGKIEDVFLDIAGGLFGIQLMVLWFRKNNRLFP